MAATIASITPALKDTWTSDTVEGQLLSQDKFLKELENTGQTFNVGNQAQTPIHTARNAGYTASGANPSSLNAAGNQTFAQAVWNYTHHHQQIRIQGSAIAASSSSDIALLRVVDNEIDGAVENLRKQLTRQIFQNTNARIATCGTTAATNVITLDATEGADAIARGWLAVGSIVDIGTAASPTSLINGETVTAVNPATPSITVTTSITTSSSNFVSWKGSRTSATATTEMTGLKDVISTSADLGGLTVATTPVWSAAKVTTTSQALTLPLLNSHNKAVMQNTGKPCDKVVMGYDQMVKFYELLQTQARFAGDGGLGYGKFEDVEYGGMKIDSHGDCLSTDIHFLTKEHLFLCSNDKPRWQNEQTGGDILAWIQDTDSYGAKLDYRLQLCCDRRNAFARLGGLTS